jgi:hypothetical protein
MRIPLMVLCLGIWGSIAAAQPQSDEKKPGDSSWRTGRTVLPDNKGQLQPQGWTGPLDTESGGGAPAESPQGGTPPPMQPAPGGASKTIVDPNPPRSE